MTPSPKISPDFRGVNVVSETSPNGPVPEPGGLPAPTLDMKAAEIIRRFLAFQNAGYLAGQPFETTYAVLAKDAREYLRSRGAL